MESPTATAPLTRLGFWIIAALLLGTGLAAGCLHPVNADGPAVEAPRQQRMAVTDGAVPLASAWFILHDSKTGHDYLVVTRGDGLQVSLMDSEP